MTNFYNKPPFDYEESYKFAKEELGADPPIPFGYHVLIKIYVRPAEGKKAVRADGTESCIILPDTVTGEDPFQNVVGQVLMLGSDCYQGEKYRYSGFWCQPKDWVIYPRNETRMVFFNKHAIQFLPDDRFYGGKISDPSLITPR